MKLASAAAGFFLCLQSAVVAQIDLNNDGFSDIWQIQFNALALDPNADADGDGATNLEEALAGTNPFDANSRIGPVEMRRAGNNWQVRWNGVVGKNYLIQTANLVGGVWSNSGSPVAGTAGLMSQNVSLNGSTGFARIEVQQVDGDGDGLFAWEEIAFGYSDSNSFSNGSVSQNDYDVARQRVVDDGRFGGFPGSIDPQERTAARFLAQASFGGTYEEIQRVKQIEMEAWIDEQSAKPVGLHKPLVDGFIAGANPELDDAYYLSRNWAWWIRATGQDPMRQRLAFALSEIFVISDKADEIADNSAGAAGYYDILVRGAFGNFRNILGEVTFSPMMGTYLSHLGNRKTDQAANIFPDENYAREVMQLFTIGLYELNPDGTRKTDGDGNFIPTYTNAEITEFAKVFTGLTYGGSQFSQAEMNEEPFLFFEADDVFDLPMDVYNYWHESGPKTLLNGYVVNHSNGRTEINLALDHLFNHPNTGPFIAQRLIQRLTTSNPSPAYVERVADVFANNGSNVRGDMKAVFKAILLDPEARQPTNLAQHGKLREPWMRIVHLHRAFDAAPATGDITPDTEWYGELIHQYPLGSPSVFNFYLPDFQPKGPIADANLTGPEFQIMNSQTSINAVNLWHVFLAWEDMFNRNGTPIRHDYSDEMAIVRNSAELVDRLDLILTGGQLSAQNRDTIITQVERMNATNEPAREVVGQAASLIALTPEFNVSR
ncbi:MAG: DUF1800 family protein [Verrucomicrobiota bacterium]